ncbi:hypothetical protein [Nonomuraea dietziae]|uniref:hypothetical protein n=1 Tax=Nonomuraea dietziae TaxID=65515 RepID=UPI0031DE415F
MNSDAQPGPTPRTSAPAMAGAPTADRLVARPIRALARSLAAPSTVAATSLGTAGVPNAAAAP